MGERESEEKDFNPARNQTPLVHLSPLDLRIDLFRFIAHTTSQTDSRSACKKILHIL
jgi:hypothetical protein